MRTGLARRIGRLGVEFTVALVALAMLSAVAGVSRAQAGESPGGTPPSGSETSVLVAGVGEVPADAEGVFLNVTAVDARSSGFLTVYPCGRTRPSTSNVNYGQRGIVPNLVYVKVGDAGKVCIYNLLTTDIVIDVNGYTLPGAGIASSLTRLTDTRTGQQVAADSVFRLPRPQTTDAASSILNVAVVDAEAAGFVTVYPCTADRPTASNVNYFAGQTVSNAVVVASDTEVCVYSLATIDLVVDQLARVGIGPFGSPVTSDLRTVTPARLIDTRAGQTPEPGSVTRIQVSGLHGVPADAQGAIVNVTAVGPSAPGFLTLYPCDADLPTASNVNYATGQIVPNAALTKLAADGSLCVYTLAETDILVDVLGYTSVSETVKVVTPFRLLDTRPAPPPPLPYEAQRLVAIYAHPIDTPAAPGRAEAFAYEIDEVSRWFDLQTGGRHPVFEMDGAVAKVHTLQLGNTGGYYLQNRNAYLTIVREAITRLGLVNGRDIPVVLYEGFTFTPIAACGMAYGPSGVLQSAYFPIGNCGIEPVAIPGIFSMDVLFPSGMKYLLAHELLHVLGAVDSCAPHELQGHISDDPRDMLYAGPLPRDWDNLMIDPGNDDYYGNGASGCTDISDSPLLGIY